MLASRLMLGSESRAAPEIVLPTVAFSVWSSALISRDFDALRNRTNFKGDIESQCRADIDRLAGELGNAKSLLAYREVVACQQAHRRG